MPCRSSTCPRGWIVGRFGVACPKPAKGTAQKAKRGRRRTLLVNDAAESAKVCERSGGGASGRIRMGGDADWWPHRFTISWEASARAAAAPQPSRSIKPISAFSIIRRHMAGSAVRSGEPGNGRGGNARAGLAVVKREGSRLTGDISRIELEPHRALRD